MSNLVAVVTGSAGLVGSSVTDELVSQGLTVIGVDNDTRRHLFGPDASTLPVATSLCMRHQEKYFHVPADLRHENCYRYLDDLASVGPVVLVVHAASQPSHEWAAGDPMADFDINAKATLRLLMWARAQWPKAVFVYMSTNKVYGDTINRLPFHREGDRWVPDDEELRRRGISEQALSVDYSLHSLFGVSKLAGDLLTQEYGRNFGMSTVCLRCGCLTGPRHRGAKQHGFLSYLAHCAKHGIPYTIIGHDGCQVRDNLHSSDVARTIWSVFCAMQETPLHGAVFNLGGGVANSISVLEAITWFEDTLCRQLNPGYEPLPRKGDHIWWVTDNHSIEEWTGLETVATISLERILTELIEG